MGKQLPYEKNIYPGIIMKKTITIMALLLFWLVAGAAYNSYTNGHIYVVVKVGEKLPDSCLPFPSAGEGVNSGKLSDERHWYKNMFWGKEGIDQLRDLVHAEDAQKLELKTTVQMRALLSKAVAETP